MGADVGGRELGHGMSVISDVTERVRALLFRGREEREMAEEMAFHQEMAGRRAFGGLEQHKEAVRDARGTRLIEESMADLGWSVRTLAHRPRFTVIAILTLALGVGGVTAVFSAVDAVLLRPLPYAEPQQLVRAYTTFDANPDERSFLSTPYFRAYRTQLAAFSNTAAIYTYDAVGAGIDLGAGAEWMRLLPVSADYFATLRAQPVLGRAFDPQEEDIGAPVVVLSYAFWERRFHGDRRVLGQSLTMSGVPHTIVGVGADGLRDPIAGAVDAWVPIDIGMNENNGSNSQPGNHWLTAIARLRPGVSIVQAQAQSDVLGAALAKTYPTGRDVRIALVPLKSDVVGPANRALELMLGAVGLVLLLVCVNVANLLLVRGTERSRELALRSALGARRLRLVRQLLIESGTLALAGGVVGLAVAWVGIRALMRFGAGSIPRLEHLTIDSRMLVSALAISSLSAIVFGLAPALRMSRTDPMSALREHGAGGTPRAEHGRMQAGLVVAQVALAFVLLLGAGLLMASLTRLRQTPLGFTADHVLTFRVALPDATYDSTARTTFYEALAQHLAQLPGVRAAGGVSRLPATGSYHQWGTTAMTGPLAGTRQADAASQNRVVSGDYFNAARIPVLEGRAFDARDDISAPHRIVISRATAQQFFPGVDPIGQRLEAGGRDNVVLGVVGDVALTGDGRTEPFVYYPHRQFAGERNWTLTQLILTAGAPLDAEAEVRRVVAALDPRLVVEESATLDDVIGQGSAQRVFTTRIFASFAGIALILASIGLFGVLSYIVTLRGKEIGIRMALGADRGAVRAMVLRQALVLTALGVGIGLCGAVGLSKVIASLLFDTSPLDPMVLGGAVVFMAVVAGVAAYFPARRATSVEPRLVLQGD
jgi:putative ABC transport system permease protein